MVFELQEGSSWCIISGIIGFVLFLGITFWLSIGLPLQFNISIILSLIVAIIGGLGLSRFEGIIGGILVGIFAAVAFILLIGVFSLNALITTTLVTVTNAFIEFIVGVAGGLISVLVRATNLKIHMRPH